MKKEARKSKGAKSVRSLPVKKLSAKTAKDVKGGVSLSFGKVHFEYKPQKSDGL